MREEISRRRTFAIISHPDAGKTTLTEKFLLYGGAIAQAGAVKGKKNTRAAVSDWMEIEKQRGISVTSSVMQFQYEGFCINILDTPGHQDFSEDTYRTLMAADSAVMVIDGSKGVEAQTRKLFKVCAMRHIPIFTFINKMDRETKDPFDLLDELENELGIETYACNWPIGCGKEFQGVYDRRSRQLLFFSGVSGKKRADKLEVELDDPQVSGLLGERRSKSCARTSSCSARAASSTWTRCETAFAQPVFFGSALTNFGVEPFLEEFLRMTPSPARAQADCGLIDTFDPDFSAFVFKIQANMNKAHRDRLAFMRICSGKFERDAEYYHVQGDKKMRLSQPQQLMAQEREIVDEAYAGDIIGVFDPGIFSIGDTICTPGQKFRFGGIPTFAPEHFSRVSPMDTMKRKQFIKGTEQIAQEGAIQIFRVPNTGMEEVIVGVVGTLQFDVFQYRMRAEYGVELRMTGLPYEQLRFIVKAPGGRSQGSESHDGRRAAGGLPRPQPAGILLLLGDRFHVCHTEFGDLIPAGASLAGAGVELIGMENREFQLRRILRPLRGQYDYIFIDCPPSLELLTLNGICAADSILVPVQCEYFALEGLSDLMSTMRAVKRRLNPTISIFGVLLTMYDGRTNFSSQVAEEVRRHFPGKVYAAVIPRNVRLAEAPSHGLPVTVYDRFSRGAAAYTALAEEIRRNEGQE
jgi:peptide chain release factor 3